MWEVLVAIESSLGCFQDGKTKSLRMAALWSVYLHCPLYTCAHPCEYRGKIAEGAPGDLVSALGEGLVRSAL